jgi:hypothetical protein
VGAEPTGATKEISRHADNRVFEAKFIDSPQKCGTKEGKEEMKKMMIVVAALLVLCGFACFTTVIDLSECDGVVHVEVLSDLPVYDDSIPILGVRITNDTCNGVHLHYMIEELRRLDDGSVVNVYDMFEPHPIMVNVYQDGQQIVMMGAVLGSPPGQCFLDIPYHWTEEGPDDSLVGFIPAGGSIELVWTARIWGDAPPGRYQYTIAGYWADEDTGLFDFEWSCNPEDQPTPTLPDVPITGPVLIVL